MEVLNTVAVSSVVALDIEHMERVNIDAEAPTVTDGEHLEAGPALSLPVGRAYYTASDVADDEPDTLSPWR
jgi:hypothetical protein